MNNINWIASLVVAILFVFTVHAYWDDGTTTEWIDTNDERPRKSFFRWPITRTRYWIAAAIPLGVEQKKKQTTWCVAGISIDFLPLSTGVILNRRSVITAANFLEPYIARMRDVRVWALGKAGRYSTPFRYRVWRWRRLIPRSLNTEHCHGPRCQHVPRHDIAVIQTWDQMYVWTTPNNRWMYAYRCQLTPKTQIIVNQTNFIYVGSGFQSMEDVKTNYRIDYVDLEIDDIVNCERYLPKWWGKFICVANRPGTVGVQNGGGLFINNLVLIGIGCFEIRYNDDRIMVFTDLRYYRDLIEVYSNISHGEYYEYAYQAWGLKMGGLLMRPFEKKQNSPFIPATYIYKDTLPLGK